MQATKNNTWSLVRRILVYVLMITAVLVISTVLVLVTLGYRFNRFNGTIQQGGLVQFISQPSGASIKVGDILLAKKTRAKITLTPGSYLVTMSKAQYQDWKKTVEVKAGSVLWLNSVWFVPNKPQSTSVLPLPELASMSARGDTIALLKNANAPTLTMVDIGGDTVKTKTVNVPASVLGATSNSRFVIKSWLSDKYLLLAQTTKTSTNWIVVNVDSPKDSARIIARAGAAPEEVMTDPRSSNAVLVRYADGSVTSQQIDGGTTNILPVPDVADMTTDGSILFYATKPKNGSVSTGYLNLNADKARSLASYRTTQPVTIISGQYFSTRYLATSVGATTQLQVAASLPSSDSDNPISLTQTKTITTPADVRFADFRANGRFVVLQQAAALTTYDIELGKRTDTPIVGATKLTSTLKWFDQFHFWSDTNGSVRQYEFDGSNQTDINKVAPGFDAAYSPNKKYLYTVAPIGKGFGLTQTKMIVD